MVKKVKKMAVGGVTDLEGYNFIMDEQIRAPAPMILKREIDAFNNYKNSQIRKHKDKKISDAQLKDSIKFVNKEIDFKKAGMTATTRLKNPIPTLRGTEQDKKTKRETDKYLKKKRAKGRNKTRMKKAGGMVKKTKSHRGDGIAKRGRTKGRMV
jgi:hypothetical protein|tara:strand:- start:815 stop:1276 length:462 start_codon:yes stop_codon:yes gene_type:complete